MNRLMYRAPKLRTELQDLDIMRRWIYRAFVRELNRWFISCAPHRIPATQATYDQIEAVCRNVVRRFDETAWSLKIIPPDREARAQRMGPTVVLRYRGLAV